ncbi:patatin-like phospholipase domain-containing protein 2 [Pholidichthys leucotaenia]
MSPAKFDLEKEWSISFAGCGFMGIYYIGAASCILERFPRFIENASKVYGSSAGSLTAAILTLGVPLEKCCADLMSMAKEARKHKLGPLHPSFNLLKRVQDTLLKHLPEDAHVRATGKLCVSLTRVYDGKNVLVSDFDSRDELIQALVCSCFVPFYCGVIPPTYRGVHYVDGAVSDNMPRCQKKTTITFSPYAGESDVSPKGGNIYLPEVRFSNVSFQVNAENVYRVTSTFFPPEPEAMAEICHGGYMDALCFLEQNNLISSESPLRTVATDSYTLVCCELVKESSQGTQQCGQRSPQEGHWWLNPQLVMNLPVEIQRVLCHACRESRSAGGLFSQMTEYLPKKVTSYLQIPYKLPVEAVYSLAQRLVDWIPDLPRDKSWLYGLVGDMYKEALKDDKEDGNMKLPLRRSSSLPSDLYLCGQREEDVTDFLVSPEPPLTSSCTITRNPHSTPVQFPPTPPSTPDGGAEAGPDKAATKSPPTEGRSWGLYRAVGWLQNITSAKTSKLKKKDDSETFSAFK